MTLFRKEKPHKKYRKYRNLLSAVVLYVEPSEALKFME